MEEWRLWRALRLQALAEAPYAYGSRLSDWQGEGETEQRWRARLSEVPFNPVAALDGEAGGIVSGTAPDQDGTAELISMWVAPAARGHGVGDALVRAVVRWAQEQRASRISLGVFEDNERAIALYRRHGFVDAGAVFGSACERHMVRDLNGSGQRLRTEE